jgi:hypothetical protein
MTGRHTRAGQSAPRDQGDSRPSPRRNANTDTGTGTAGRAAGARRAWMGSGHQRFVSVCWVTATDKKEPNRVARGNFFPAQGRPAENSSGTVPTEFPMRDRSTPSRRRSATGLFASQPTERSRADRATAGWSGRRRDRSTGSTVETPRGHSDSSGACRHSRGRLTLSPAFGEVIHTKEPVTGVWGNSFLRNGDSMCDHPPGVVGNVRHDLNHNSPTGFAAVSFRDGEVVSLTTRRSARV